MIDDRRGTKKGKLKNDERRTKDEKDRECKRVRGLSTCIRYGDGNIRDIQKFPSRGKIFFNRSDQKIFEICMHESRGGMSPTQRGGNGGTRQYSSINYQMQNKRQQKPKHG
jgi:hypothetical protein